MSGYARSTTSVKRLLLVGGRFNTLELRLYKATAICKLFHVCLRFKSASLPVMTSTLNNKPINLRRDLDRVMTSHAAMHSTGMEKGFHL